MDGVNYGVLMLSTDSYFIKAWNGFHSDIVFFYCYFFSFDFYSVVVCIFHFCCSVFFSCFCAAIWHNKERMIVSVVNDVYVDLTTVET